MSPNESTRSFRTQKSRYQLVKRIANGPLSNVWRARDTLTGRDVVLKRLDDASVDDPIARRRLKDEAEANDLVSHPNAVPVVDRMFGRNEAALVFPFVAGRTLAERLHGEGPLAPREAASVALDVCDVLADAHDSGVIHRDVKPANILLGDDGRARLIDFGISRSIDRQIEGDGGSDNSIELTGSGMAVGTLPYMAPEHLTGAGPSPAGDVFALGVVLYEMLSGRRPYEGRSPAEQLVLQQQPPAAIEAPSALATLTLAALDPRPDNRPSAAQFGRSLSAWLDGRADAESATTTLPVIPIPAATRPRMSPRLGAPMIALAAVFLAAIVAVPASIILLGGSVTPVAPAVQPASEVAIVTDAPVEPTALAEAPPRPTTQAPVDQSRPAVSTVNQPDPHPAPKHKDKKRPGKGHGKGHGKGKPPH